MSLFSFSSVGKPYSRRIHPSSKQTPKVSRAPKERPRVDRRGGTYQPPELAVVANLGTNRARLIDPF